MICATKLPVEPTASASPRNTGEKSREFRHIIMESMEVEGETLPRALNGGQRTENGLWRGDHNLDLSITRYEGSHGAASFYDNSLPCIRAKSSQLKGFAATAWRGII